MAVHVTWKRQLPNVESGCECIKICSSPRHKFNSVCPAVCDGMCSPVAVGYLQVSFLLTCRGTGVSFCSHCIILYMWVLFNVKMLCSLFTSNELLCVYRFFVGFVEFTVVNNGSFKVLCVSWTCQIKFDCTVQHTSSDEL
jgi:hypothetical protein